jgi:hypothetical protein
MLHQGSSYLCDALGKLIYTGVRAFVGRVTQGTRPTKASAPVKINLLSASHK